MVAVSEAYRKISQAEAEAMPLADAWRDPSIPMQQFELTAAEFALWLNGSPVAPFDVLKSCLSPIGSGSVLEIGCGVGHNCSVIQNCGQFEYTGVDYSEAAIALASRQTAGFFHVMDACSLDFDDRSFGTVISGCCLLHIVGWRTALTEAARVADRYLILHRTPVSDEPTRYFVKKAYGVQVVELAFNRAELITETEAHGFTLTKTFPVTKGQETLLFERALFHHPV